ncbi:methylated-DNA--[protein]-cysteine S-methyltransferase [Halomonas sp. ZH2S]|uniref:Methylated-DNA--protein-cysteine methyltransferase n=1 Tax=Vreelandella zhuhanensis TaxID=2684210 RepID=A0A7X3H0Z6_9GAMM|nr:methylated-DNA--[protein]-cysteine S-methyltransferase [Halomonas zhuhanensis]MWJ27535.1 methylated-DNA--[protein]-cysteine S-methyltransferase [Halomonas zhuhanensis]
MYIDYFSLPCESPIGLLQLRATDQGITHIDYVENELEPVRSHPLLERCKTQLEEYFTGRRQHFDIPLAAAGTPFQQRVWAQLSAIPYGTTCSYSAIAARLQQPTAARAVGMANSRNPIVIVVPCHRVIGGNGSLTGYAGGLPRKQWLLHHEA